MRILFLAAWWPSRVHPTHGNFVEKHARLVAQDHELLVLAIQADEALEQGEQALVEKEQDGYALIQLYFGQTASASQGRKMWLRWQAYQLGMKKVRRQFGVPDLIHAHILLDAGMIAAWWSRKWQCPFVVTEHSTAYQSPAALRGLRQLLGRWACRNAAYILPVSQQLGYSMEVLQGLKGRYRVVSNVVDTNVFTYQTPPTSPPVKFLHVSNFHEAHKNIRGLLVGFAEALLECPNLQLRIAGDGKLETVRQLMIDIGLSDKNVSLSGPHAEAEVAALIQTHHAMVLFSNYENQPVVILEALSSGRPCIATQVGGIPDMIQVPAEGYVVPARDQVALREAMIKISTDYHTYDLKSIRSRALAICSEAAVLAQLNAVYEEITKQT